MQTDNQCAASLIRCLAEILRRGYSRSILDEFKTEIGRTYDLDALYIQLDTAMNPGRGARHLTLAALEQAADRLEE